MGTSGTEPKQAQTSLLGAEDGGFPFEVVWRGETCTFPIFALCQVSPPLQPTGNSEVEPPLAHFFLQKRLYFFSAHTSENCCVPSHSAAELPPAWRNHPLPSHGAGKAPSPCPQHVLVIYS